MGLALFGRVGLPSAVELLELLKLLASLVTLPRDALGLLGHFQLRQLLLPLFPVLGNDVVYVVLTQTRIKLVLEFHYIPHI